MNPIFRTLVIEAKNAGYRVIVRTSLTIFFEDGMDDLPEFYRDQSVELIASLTYYLEEGVDNIRGNGAFKKSIEALQRLNSVGYAKESPGLQLSLVYNPGVVSCLFPVSARNRIQTGTHGPIRHIV